MSVTLKLKVTEYSCAAPFSKVYQHHYSSDECRKLEKHEQQNQHISQHGFDIYYT